MKVDESNQESSLGGLIDKFSEVFKEGLGTFKGPKVKIHVDPEARPKSFKARPVPYAMTGKIEVELKKLQDEGTIEPVQFSEWAAPIVPILKLDDSIQFASAETTNPPSIKYQSWTVILSRRLKIS